MTTEQWRCPKCGSRLALVFLTKDGVEVRCYVKYGRGCGWQGLLQYKSGSELTLAGMLVSS